MATEAYNQEPVCLKKGEREENALKSESFGEKVTELPGNQAKQLETSSLVAETVYTPPRTGKPTEESGIFFQALSVTMVIADEHSNTPESYKAAKQTEPEEETIEIEEKAIESEVCGEDAPEKAEPEVGLKNFDSVVPGKKEAFSKLEKNQGDGDGFTSSQDAAGGDIKETATEHATIVADFKEHDLNETPREFVKEETVDAQEASEQCEIGSKDIEEQKSEESVEKIEQDEGNKEIKPDVEMEKREQNGLLKAIPSDACISTQTISQVETTEHEDKEQDVNVLEKDQDEVDVTHAQEVTFVGSLQEKCHQNEDNEHEVVKSEGSIEANADVCISTLTKESVKVDEPCDEKAIEKEACEEDGPKKVELEEGLEISDSKAPSQKKTLNAIEKDQGDSDGVTSSQESPSVDVEETTVQHVTKVIDFKEQDLNEKPREVITEETEDAEEASEECEKGAKEEIDHIPEESVKKTEKQEETKEIKPGVEIEKKEQNELLPAITTDVCITTQTKSQVEKTEHEEEDTQNDDCSPSIKEVCEETGLQEDKYEEVKGSAIETVTKDENEGKGKEQDVNVLETDEGKDEVTSAQDVKKDLQEKTLHNEDDGRDVTAEESIEKDTEVIRSCEKTEQKMLINAIPSDVCISKTEPEEEPTEKDDEVAVERDDGQTNKSEESLFLSESSNMALNENETCEEDGPKKVELEEGLEISDSKAPSQKKTLNEIEKDQGDSDGITSSQESPSVDVEETTTVQHVTTAIDFKEQDLNEKPRDVIMEETEDKSLDAHEASEECEKGAKEEIDHILEESVKKTEKEEETKEIKLGVEIEKKEQNELLPATQTKSQVEKTEHEEEDTQNDDCSPSIKEVCEETGLEKDKYGEGTVTKDENEGEGKEQEVDVLETDEGKDEVTSAQDVKKDFQEKTHHNEDDERDPTAEESIEKDTEVIRSSEKTEQEMLINAIPSDVCISKTEPEEEPTEKDDEEAVERDDGQTNKSEESLLLSDSSNMALNENETVRKDEDQGKEQEVCVSEKVQSGGDDVTSSENVSNEQEQHTEEIKPSVETTEEKDVCISKQIESQEKAIQNEDAIENDGDRKDKSDNSFVNEVCKENDLKKTEFEEEIKLADSSNFATKETVDEATEENKSSDETKEHTEQEGVLNVITTDVCSSTQTENIEKTTEGEENNDEEAADNDGQAKKPESPLVEVVCEATSTEMAESEEVKHSDSSSMPLNEHEALGREETLGKGDDITTSEVQGGRDDVTSSQDSSNEDIKETSIGQHDTTVAYVEERQGVIAVPKEILTEEAEDKSIEAEEISLELGQPNEQNVEEAHPCLGKTITENPEDEIKKEDKNLSHENVEDTNDDTTKEEKCTLEQEPIEEHSGREEVSKEKVTELHGTTEVEPREEIILSTLIETSTEDNLNSEKKKAESKKLPTEDCETVSEVQIPESVLKSEESVPKEECFISETQTHIDAEKGAITEEISSEEKTEQTTEIKQATVKEVCAETSSEKAEFEEKIKFSDTSNMGINERGITTFKVDDQEKDQEVNMSTGSQGEDDITSSHIDVSEEKENLKEKNHRNEGNEDDFIKSGEGLGEDTQEIKSSVDTKENTEHVIATAVCSSTQIEIHEETIENDEKNGEKAIEYDKENLKNKQDDVEETKMGKQATTVACFEEGRSLGTVTKEVLGKEEVEGDKSVIAQEETEHYDDGENDKREQKPEEHTDEIKRSVEINEEKDVCISTQTEFKEEATKNEENDIERDGDQNDKSDNPFVKEVCEKNDLTTTDSEERQPSDSSDVKTRESVVHEGTKETKCSDETKENMEQQRVLNDITTDIFSSTQTENTKKTTVSEENNDGQTEKPESPLVEVKQSDSFSTALNENETLNKEGKLEKEDEINTIEVQGGWDEITSSQNASNEDIKETTISQCNTTDAYVEGQDVSTMPKEILIEEAEEKSVDAEKMSLELGQPKKQAVEETHPCESKTISENPEDEIKNDRDLSHESVEGTDDNTAKEEKGTLEHEPVEEHSGRDLNVTTEVEPQEDITPSIASETSTKDTSNSGKEKAESENLPIEDLETVSEVQIPEVVPKSEEPMLKEECFISETETHLDEEKGTITQEISSDEKTEQLTEIKQETVKEVCKEETSSEKIKLEEGLELSDSSNIKINEEDIKTFKEDDQNLACSHIEVSEVKEDLQERNYHNEGNEGDFIKSGGVDEDVGDIKSSVGIEDTEHVITTSSSMQIEPDEKTMVNEEKKDESVENDENKIVSKEENFEKKQEDIKETDLGEHATTVAYFEEGRSLGTITKEVLGEAEEEEKPIIAQEKTEHYGDGRDDEREQKQEEHTDEIKPSVKTYEKKDVCISTKDESQEEPTKKEEVAIELDGDTKENAEHPFVKEVYEESDLTNTESEVVVKHADSFSTTLNENEALSTEEKLEKEDEINTSKVQGGGDEVTSSQDASNDEIKETTIGQHDTTVTYVEEEHGASVLPKEILTEETKDKSIDAEEIPLELGQPDKQNVKEIGENPKDEINKEDKDVSHESVEDTNDDTTKEEKCTLEHETVEEHSGQDEVSKEKVTAEFNGTTKLEPQEDTTPSNSLETSTEDTLNLEIERTEFENFPIKDPETVSEVPIPELAHKSEELVLKEECLISETGTHLDEEKGIITEEISSDEKTEQTTEIKQGTVKEVCEETGSEKAEFEERIKLSDTCVTETNKRGTTAFKVDDQEMDQEVNMLSESQGKDSSSQNEGNERGLIKSGEGVDEDPNEIKSSVETKENTEHVITTSSSTQIEPEEEATGKNDKNEIRSREIDLEKKLEDVCSSVQTESKEESIENKETNAEAIYNDDGQVNLENQERVQEPEISELQGGGDDVISSQNASNEDTEETLIGQHGPTTVHFEEGVGVNAITKEITGEEVKDKSNHAQVASEQSGNGEKDKTEQEHEDSVNKPVNPCSETSVGGVQEEDADEVNKEIESELEANYQGDITEDRIEMKDEAVITEKASKELGETKEQNVEEIEACLMETISEKTEDKITKDEDLSHDSIKENITKEEKCFPDVVTKEIEISTLEHINENITKEEKCFPDVVSNETEISTLEHKPVEEQNNSQDEVSKGNFTDLDEPTAVEPQEDTTPSSSLGTSAEDASNSDKAKAPSKNLPLEDLEPVSEVHIPEVMPKSEDSKTKEECLISATETYAEEENRIATKEISSVEILETRGSTQKSENSYSTSEENVPQLEQIAEINSLNEKRDMKEEATQESQLKSTEDCSDIGKDVILTEEIEQVPLEIEKEKRIDEFKEQTTEEDSYSSELEEKSAQNQKEIVREISNLDSVPAENPEVTEVTVDGHIGHEDLQGKEDATVESVDLSNPESTTYPSESEKIATRALKTDSDINIPEVLADSENPKVKEECNVLATAEYTGENNVEDQDAKTNEISIAPDEEQEEEDVTKVPTKSDESKSNDLIIEEKALTKENLEIHGELEPTSEPVIEEDQVTIETKPQPEQPDITSENIKNDQTLESKLEHKSEKDLDGKGHIKDDVTFAPESETKSIENLNVTMKNIILTDEVEQVAVETEKEKERNGYEGQVSEEDNCPKELESTSAPDQKKLENEIEYSTPILLGNTEVTEVKAESQIEVENTQTAEDLSCLPKASSIIETSQEEMHEGTEQTITVIDEASKEKTIPVQEDSKPSKLQVNLPEIESTDTPSNAQDSMKPRDDSIDEVLIKQIERSSSKHDELLEAKDSVQDTEEPKLMADKLEVKDETVASEFKRLEDTVTDNEKETLDETQVDDSAKTTYGSVLSSTEKDIKVGSEESSVLKREEKPTEDSEIADEVAEIVPECREASAILTNKFPEASPEMLLVKHEDKITENPEVLSSVEKDVIDVQKHEKNLDHETEVRIADVVSNVECSEIEPRNLDIKEATFEFNKQDNQKEQTKEADESIEAAIPVEDVKTSTREPELRSVDLEVPSIMDETADKAISQTVEVQEAEKELLKDKHLESTCERSKPIEEGSGMKQEPLELDTPGTLGTEATDDLKITQKYITDDLIKVSQTHPEVQQYEVPDYTVDKQSHLKESTETKILTEKIDSSHEQGEPVAKSLKPETSNLKANAASGTEPQGSNTVFVDQKEMHESAEPAKIVLHEPTKGKSEVAENLTGERDSALTKEQQVVKEEIDESGVKTDEENEEDYEDDEKMGSGSDAPVMVEASKDMDVKVHKKSHNILSGVGSKVKHSIAKVKKAITGKSSPPKSPSAKEKNQVIG